MSSLRPHPGRTRPAHRKGLPRRSRNRLFAVLAVFGVAFTLITAKLVSIQGMGSKQLQEVTDGAIFTSHPAALRGSILAANGDELALSEMVPWVFADPGEVRDAAVLDKRTPAAQYAHDAGELAGVLHLSATAIAAELAERTTYVVLAEDQTQAVATDVGRLGLEGVGVEDEPMRYHPDGDLAGQLIGGINDNGGDSGLEYEYNDVLHGTAGHLVEQVDQQGQPIPGSVTVDKPAVDGDDVLTTINEALQYQTQEALAKAVRNADAASGTALVMDTRTGDLLAVASVVAGPHGPVEAPSAQAFTDVYEPGSVAKIITISAALTQHTITPSTEITIPNEYLAGGTYFHDAESHPTEILSPTGVLAQSSNIGAIQIGQGLGAQRLYSYEKAYGLTQRTAVDFPGESAGLMTPLADFSGTTLPTMSFGEANAVTAAQMIAAVNTVADGGVYVSPRLVTAIVGPDGREQPTATPAPRRVIPASVASTMTGMLEQVVSSGTGTSAKIGSYAVAGKTGTANALDPEGSGYLTNSYVSSFAGFAPATDPAITTMVVVNQTALYGAQASAGTFSTITHDALLDLGIPSSGSQPAPSLASVPLIDGQPETSLLGQ